jgi:hypothetical protein
VNGRLTDVRIPAPTAAAGCLDTARALAGHKIDAGDLRRVKPVSTVWGTERAMRVDRHNIEAFLGGMPRDEKSEMLHATAENLLATYVADHGCATTQSFT